jgi:thiamine monophosphate synthase
VGIGGITLENYKAVLQAGADGAAIVSAILGADDICQTVRKLKNMALEAKSVKI